MTPCKTEGSEILQDLLLSMRVGETSLERTLHCPTQAGKKAHPRPGAIPSGPSPVGWLEEYQFSPTQKVLLRKSFPKHLCSMTM